MSSQPHLPLTHNKKLINSPSRDSGSAWRFSDKTKAQFGRASGWFEDGWNLFLSANRAIPMHESITEYQRLLAAGEAAAFSKQLFL
jgi:hypothetical protein